MRAGALVYLAPMILSALSIPVRGQQDLVPVGLESAISRTLSEYRAPGLAVVIVKDGKIVLQRGFGVRDLFSRAPVDEHTVFAIGSLTKPFVSTIVVSLASRGVIDLDASIAQYLPEIRLCPMENARDITIRTLLNHSSGLHPAGSDLLWVSHGIPANEILNRFQFVERAQSPGTTFYYQNMGYAALGRVIENVTSSSFDRIVDSELFQPLDMLETRTDLPRDAARTNTARAYLASHDLRTYAGLPREPMDGIAPALGAYSSASDLAKWLMLQLGDAQLPNYDSTLIQSTHVPEIAAASPLISPETRLPSFTSYGAGWYITTIGGDTIVFHNGTVPGMTAVLGFLPRLNLGVAVLHNSSLRIPDLVFFQILAAYTGTVPLRFRSQIQTDAEQVAGAAVAPPAAQEVVAGTYSNGLLGTLRLIPRRTEDSYHVQYYPVPSAPDLVFRGELAPTRENSFLIRWEDLVLNSYFGGKQVKILHDRNTGATELLLQAGETLRFVRSDAVPVRVC